MNGRAYINEDFFIPLPVGVDACDIGTLTIWCEPFTVFFAVLPIPTQDIFVSQLASYFLSCPFYSIVFL